MKVLIVSHKKEAAESLAKSIGLEVVDAKPDFVLSYGGDGTLMKSEFLFPGVPKVILKDSFIAKKASSLSNNEVLRRFKEGKYKIDEFWKLETQAKGKRMLALNDITVHNEDARHAIRYRVWVDQKPIEHEIIGDGVVVATPFGSTGYYRSITHSFFEEGLGLAFNNSTEQSDHMVLKEDTVIKIKIVRGPAVVYSDNQKDYITLGDGDEVLVKKSGESAKIVVVD